MWLLQEVCSLVAVFSIVAAKTTSTLPENLGRYKFGYTVKADETGDYHTRHEVSDGKEVRGSYSVGEPNGDLRVVTYTADRVNGFRALVKVHPGGSPIQPNGGAKQRSESALSETNRSREVNVNNNHTEQTENKSSIASSTRNNSTIASSTRNNSTIASSTTLDHSGRGNHTDVKNHPPPSEDLIKNKTKINNQPTINEDESVTLFKILPALDKHVPKVEYIVEDILGDDEEEKSLKKQNSELRNGEDELFEGSQIIPVKILQDPTDQSPEMVGLDANIDVGYVTTIANEDVINTNDQEVYEETPINDIQNTTLDNLLIKEPTTLAPQSINTSTTGHYEITKEPDLSSAQETSTPTKLPQEVPNTTEPEIKQPANEGMENITVQNNAKLEYTGLETQQPTTKHTQDLDIKLSSTPIKHFETEKTTIVATQPPMKLTTTEQIKQSETEIPNKVFLAALMFPSMPILKFTCLPDTTDQVGIKTTPTTPNQFSKLTNATPPQKIPLASTVIPLYPFQLLNFKPQKSSEAPPQKGFKMSSQPPLPAYNDFTTIPSTPFVNLRMLPRNPPTGLTTPQQSLDTPKPTRYTDYTHQKSMANRHHYPLYPIPPPWTYHPLRPSHNHPRHLPIFVLPMSHNFNFAPTFNPEAFDGHHH